MSRYSGWEIDATCRDRLLKLYPPVYPDVIAHHVTFERGGKVAPDAAFLTVIGRVDDGAGVEALVVCVDGTTTRPDGKTYHVTWSIDRAAGRKPVDSNTVIAALGYDKVDYVSIRSTPKVFE